LTDTPAAKEQLVGGIVQRGDQKEIVFGKTKTADAKDATEAGGQPEGKSLTK